MYSENGEDGIEEEKRCSKKHKIWRRLQTVFVFTKGTMRKLNVIRSRGHKLFTEEINKVALSASDHERIICEDKIKTLSYGHYSEVK